MFTGGVLVAQASGRLLPAGMGPRVLVNLAMHATFLAGVLVVARHRGYTAVGLGWWWRPLPPPAAVLRLAQLWLVVLVVDLGVAAVSVAVLGVGPERLAGQLADHAAGAGGVLLAALTALVAPVTEEVVFCGLLLGGLLAWSTRQGSSRPTRLHAAAAVLVSAAGFAAVHGLLDPNSWRAVPAITLGGIVYGMIAVRDGHLMRAVVLTRSPTASPSP
jgi:membrane protease YdiL (CAAX protease family)